MAVPSLRAPCSKNGGPSDDVTENPFFTELSCFLLSDDLSIRIPGNSIFTRCAPTAWCCFSLRCRCNFFFFFSPFPPPSLFPLNRLERLFVMFLSGFGVRAASCCEVSIYRGIVQQCEPTATARVGLLKDR